MNIDMDLLAAGTEPMQINFSSDNIHDVILPRQINRLEHSNL